MSSKRITYIENVLHWLGGVQYPVSRTILNALCLLKSHVQ